MKKLFLVSVISIFLLFLSTQISFAQTCGDTSDERCADPNVGCDPGTETYDPSQNPSCALDYSGLQFICCVDIPGAPPPSCPGTCRNACTTGETPQGNQGCPSASPVCCVAQSPHAQGLGEPCGPGNTCDGELVCHDAVCIIVVDVELKCGVDGINTAIGCIPINNSSALIGFFLRWAIGIGGGIAFILILVAGFQIITSQGDPQKLQAGKELLTSAIVGLLLIIFSVFILEVIGVDILGIPGFNQ